MKNWMFITLICCIIAFIGCYFFMIFPLMDIVSLNEAQDPVLIKNAYKNSKVYLDPTLVLGSTGTHQMSMRNDDPVPAYCKDMTEAFITAGSLNMQEELGYLTKSIHMFSTRCIIIYMIGNKFPLRDIDNMSFPHLVIRQAGYFHARMQAIWGHAIRDCRLKRGVWLDPATIVNYNVDILFDVLDSHLQSLPDKRLRFPLFPLHTCTTSLEGIRNAMLQMRVFKQTMPYVHPASPILFTRDSATFFEEFIQLHGNLKLNAEVSVNVFLWKKNITSHLTQMGPLLRHYWNYIQQEDNISYIENWWMKMHEAELWFPLFRAVPKHKGLMVIETIRNTKLPAYYDNGKWSLSSKKPAIFIHGWKARTQCICQTETCKELAPFNGFRDYGL